MSGQPHLVEMTADIVSAYVANNNVVASELPGLIQLVYAAIMDVSGDPVQAPATPQAPAVSVRKSLTPDYLVCLEDGRRFKSLKRHLRTHYNLSPEEYRAKWSLPNNYPMVAPNYSAFRSVIAKSLGLGQGGRTATTKPIPRRNQKSST